MTADTSPCGKSREYHTRNAWAWECSHPDCAFRSRVMAVHDRVDGLTPTHVRDDNDVQAFTAPDRLLKSLDDEKDLT